MQGECVESVALQQQQQQFHRQKRCCYKHMHPRHMQRQSCNRHRRKDNLSVCPELLRNTIRQPQN